VVIVRPFIVNTPREAESISQRLTRELSLNPRVWDPAGTGKSNFTPNDITNPDPDKARKAKKAADKAAAAAATGPDNAGKTKPVEPAVEPTVEKP
jgi:hypothetical protein